MKEHFDALTARLNQEDENTLSKMYSHLGRNICYDFSQLPRSKGAFINGILDRLVGMEHDNLSDIERLATVVKET